MFLKYFWSQMLFVGTASILVFSRNSNRTMNYSLGNYLLTGKNIYLKLFLELHSDVLVMILQYFWSKMLFVGTASILVFSRNSNRTMNYSLGNYLLTGKKIYLKLFLELHSDVLVMILQYFWSKMLFVGTASILVFSWNSLWTMNYSLGTYFLTGKNIYLKLFLELHSDVLVMILQYFRSKMLFVGTASILVFSRNSNRTMNYSLGNYLLTGKKFYLKLFLELHSDVLVMILQYFWSKMLFLGTASILVFSWNSLWTMNYSHGTYFLTRKKMDSDWDGTVCRVT